MMTFEDEKIIIVIGAVKSLACSNMKAPTNHVSSALIRQCIKELDAYIEGVNSSSDNLVRALQTYLNERLVIAEHKKA